MNTLYTTLVKIDVFLPREFMLLWFPLATESSLAYPFYLEGFSTSLTDMTSLYVLLDTSCDVGWDYCIPHGYRHDLMEPTRLSHDTIMYSMRSTKTYPWLPSCCFDQDPQSPPTTTVVSYPIETYKVSHYYRSVVVSSLDSQSLSRPLLSYILF